jgi:hypothetical protein
MARLFDDASSEYMYTASTPVTTYPLTMACWFNSDDITINQQLMAITDTSADNDWFSLVLRGGDAGDFIGLQANGGGFQQTVSSLGYTANQDHHACGVFTSNTSRTIYADGGNSATGGTSVNPSPVDSISIGALGRPTVADYCSAKIGESAIWNVALTAEEVAALAKGYSPLLIRPQNLVFYSKLVRDEDIDIIGGLGFTLVNTPSIGTHFPIIYPAPVFSGFGAAAAAAAGNPWYYYVQH